MRRRYSLWTLVALFMAGMSAAVIYSMALYG